MISSAEIFKARILIVDDKQANISLMRKMLAGAGYVAVTATMNPYEVCELHRKNPYALIMLDLLMPGMDGFEVMKGLNAVETEGYLPVLVTTAQSEHKLRALQAGAKDFVSKPFDLGEILMRVYNLLEVRLLHLEAAARTKQAEAREEAIRASELRYRRLFEAARDGILILDASTGRITDVNPYLVELLGFSRGGILGRTVAELSPFKDIESNEAMLAKLQAEGRVRYDDLPLETQDGRLAAVEFVSNVYQAGEERVIQCNIRDITESKRARDEIQRLNSELEQRVLDRTAQLLSANEELDAFSYSVSHDLRAPLRHVMGFVLMLQTEAGPTLSVKSLDHLKTISESAKRMGMLIDDLLAFSHLGQAEMHKVHVDLNNLVAETLGDFAEETKTRRIAWQIGDLPAVQGDRALLRMAMVNLLSNAVKFTGHRAQPKIEIGQAAGSDAETVVFVRDNGAGFDPDCSAKLFGVFQRLHGEDEFEGTGIGLANVQRIVHRHGGRAWAEGAVDRGATFYFSVANLTKGANERRN